MATGGAEQERKGAPRCVRVSVPVRPELCLSDRQRREKKTREKRGSQSAKTEREKFACPKPEPDKNPGVVGGGWVHRQVVATCRWPVPSGQATRERERGKTEGKSRERRKHKHKDFTNRPSREEPLFEISKSTKQTALGIAVSKMRIVRATSGARKILLEQPNQRRREHPEKDPGEKRAASRAIYRTYLGQTHTA